MLIKYFLKCATNTNSLSISRTFLISKDLFLHGTEYTEASFDVSSLTLGLPSHSIWLLYNISLLRTGVALLSNLDQTTQAEAHPSALGLIYHM